MLLKITENKIINTNAIIAVKAHPTETKVKVYIDLMNDNRVELMLSHDKHAQLVNTLGVKEL